MEASNVVPNAEVRSRRRLWKSTVAVAFAVAFLGMGPAWLDPPDALAQGDDPPQLSISLEFDGFEPQVFSEIRGLSSEIDAIELRHSRPRQPRVDGRASVVLSRQLSADRDLWDWHKRIVESGRIQERRSGSIVVLDPSGGEIARWSFTNAWPSEIFTGGLRVATGDINVLVETVTLQAETIERESP